MSYPQGKAVWPSYAVSRRIKPDVYTHGWKTGKSLIKKGKMMLSTESSPLYLLLL